MNTLRAGLALMLAAAGGAPGQTAECRWRAEVEVKEGVEFASIRLRPEAYERSESEFRDLRIVGPDGKEVGWTWADRVAGNAGARRWHDANRLLNLVTTPGGALQFVAEARASEGLHHAVGLDVREPEFQRKVVVETGDDLRNWDVAARGSIVRLVVEGQRLESLRVSYPASTRRYVRVTVEDWPDPKTLVAVEVDSRVEVKEEWAVVGRVEGLKKSEQRRHPEAPVRVGRSEWAFSMDLPPFHGGRLVVETPSVLFARSATVESSADGEQWRESGSGMLYRAAGKESLEVGLGRVYPRRMRLSLTEWDNPALEIAAVRLEAPVRRVVFPARVAGRYQVYLGKEEARMPDYDVGAVLARSSGVAPAAVELGAWVENPEYVPPAKPVSERWPWLLPGVLGLAVAVMGWWAWGLLRRAG
jgi:hypothetical protein